MDAAGGLLCHMSCHPPSPRQSLSKYDDRHTHTYPDVPCSVCMFACYRYRFRSAGWLAAIASYVCTFIIHMGEEPACLPVTLHVCAALSV
mmetsp:Transcript_5102/g.13967  ORF Transcript_5102/g.13967 Transcript_5102/m.13967 type:complete len:90 (+) Transcript_5102:236-505(+)